MKFDLSHALDRHGQALPLDRLGIVLPKRMRPDDLDLPLAHSAVGIA
jgi:hypothetical protein